MSSPAVFDLDALLAPIPGNSPTGVDLREDENSPFYDLRSLRLQCGADERQINSGAEDAPARAPWDKLADDCESVLRDKSKDLQIACWMLEAQARVRRDPPVSEFAALRDGFKLVNGLCTQYWDTLFSNPGDEPSDKGQPLLTLNEGALVAPIRKIPLTLREDPGPFSYWQIDVQQKKGDMGTIDTLVRKGGREPLHAPADRPRRGARGTRGARDAMGERVNRAPRTSARCSSRCRAWSSTSRATSSARPPRRPRARPGSRARRRPPAAAAPGPGRRRVRLARRGARGAAADRALLPRARAAGDDFLHDRGCGAARAPAARRSAAGADGRRYAPQDAAQCRHHAAETERVRNQGGRTTSCRRRRGCARIFERQLREISSHGRIGPQKAGAGSQAARAHHVRGRDRRRGGRARSCRSSSACWAISRAIRRKPLKPLRDRKFIQIDRDNFNDVMARMTPGAQFPRRQHAGRRRQRDGRQLKFNSMDDFEPARIVEQVEPLKKLLETRNKLRDLMTKVDRSEDLEHMLEEVLQNTDALKKLSEEIKIPRRGQVSDGPKPQRQGASRRRRQPTSRELRWSTRRSAPPSRPSPTTPRI